MILREYVLEETARVLIESSYRVANIIPANQAVTVYFVERGRLALNRIIKMWQSQGLHLWSETEAILPLNPGQRMYSIGPNGDECANELSFFFTNLENTVEDVAGSTVLSVFDVDGVVVPPNLLTFSLTDSVNDWTITNGTGVSDGVTLTLTNVGDAVKGVISISTVVGQEYILSFDYQVGISTGGTFTAVAGTTTLATAQSSVDASIELRFTATSDTTNIELLNDNATVGTTVIASNMFYFDTSTGSRIGIEQNDLTRFWAQVIGTDTTVSPPTVTISAGLPLNAALQGTVYYYDDKVERPLRILQTRYADFITASEIPTIKWSREEYFDQPDKDATGTVVQWYYNPTLQDGELYVWQVAQRSTQLLRFTYSRPLYITENLIDSPDIPAEWFNSLMWAVARELSVENSVSESTFIRIAAEAESSLELSLGYDVEDTYLVFQPDYSGR